MGIDVSVLWSNFEKFDTTFAATCHMKYLAKKINTTTSYQVNELYFYDMFALGSCACEQQFLDFLTEPGAGGYDTASKHRDKGQGVIDKVSCTPASKSLIFLV